MEPLLNRIMLPARDVQAPRDFYERHFGFAGEKQTDDRVTALRSANDSTILMAHPAGKDVGSSNSISSRVFPCR